VLQTLSRSVARLAQIPGMSEPLARVIIVEIGLDFIQSPIVRSPSILMTER
jgi:hypothetical protein